MRIADSDTRRKIIDSTELISYCERYGMEVIPEGVKVNQLVPDTARTETKCGVAVTCIGNGTFTINGTDTGGFRTYFSLGLPSSLSQLPSTTKFLIWYEREGSEDCGIHTFNRMISPGAYIYPLSEFRFPHYPAIYTLNGKTYNDAKVRVIFRNLTELGLADKSLEWLQSNRPDLFQNLDYIPETKTIKSVTRRIK